VKSASTKKHNTNEFTDRQQQERNSKSNKNTLKSVTFATQQKDTSHQAQPHYNQQTQKVQRNEGQTLKTGHDETKRKKKGKVKSNKQRKKKRRRRKSKGNKAAARSPGRNLRIGTVNVNGATREGMLIAEALYALAEEEELDILLLQDTRATSSDLKGLQYRLNVRANLGRNIRVIGTTQELDDKMLMVGGTAIVLFGRAARFLQSWGAERTTSTGMLTWARLKNRDDKLLVISTYFPDSEGERDLRDGRKTYAARARHTLQHLENANRQKGIRTHGTSNPQTWIRSELEVVCREEGRDATRGTAEVVVGGDFNMQSDDTSLSRLMTRIGMKLNDQADEALWTFGKNKEESHRTKPDHIHSTTGMEKWRIYEGGLSDIISDHRPLIGEITNTEDWGTVGGFEDSPLTYERIDLKCKPTMEDYKQNGSNNKPVNSEADKFARYLKEKDSLRQKDPSEDSDDYLLRLHTIILDAAKEATAYRRGKKGTTK
jgi:hypothetical protein